ncbi:hypothetical protein JTE90_007122 [Oedothorax gibbosus]|uniref:Uncharacterized protein n=1 Tax=Oedothorax gibbosus TaxID=931172 RepID=A0AAV6VT16_9ARAC|nr:hypothetical protein JTE90_007122 [Oedothorax gibbosus]
MKTRCSLELGFLVSGSVTNKFYIIYTLSEKVSSIRGEYYEYISILLKIYFSRSISEGKTCQLKEDKEALNLKMPGPAEMRYLPLYHQR